MTESTRPTTRGERIVILLGWDLDDFWKEIALSDEAGLREALAILEAPTEPDADRDRRAQHGIEQIRKQLTERFP